MEVYVDDMLIKRMRPDQHIKDLREAFTELRKFQMKLNLLKCAFGMTLGKFLGFLVT